MRTVRQALDRIGWFRLPVTLQIPGVMPLRIEVVARSTICAVLSVSHLSGKSRCPEILFRVSHDKWQPVSYRNDATGCVSEDWPGLAALAAVWDARLCSSGLMAAAERYLTK